MCFTIIHASSIPQFVTLTNWGDLDYLIVDMPPGTGDIQLTLAQIMNISAAIIVTTPQRLSFVDVVKGIDLFDTVNIPCVAVVENMAEFSAYNFTPEFYEDIGIKAASVAAAATALSSDPSKAFSSVSKCIKEAIDAQKLQLRLFGEGHNMKLREMWGIDNIVSLPLMQEVSQCGDSGTPYVLSYPDSSIAKSFVLLAQNVVNEINRLSNEATNTPQTLSYDEASNFISFNGKKITPTVLRGDCRCATCVEEFTGKRLLKKENIPLNIKPMGMAPIGRYAMSVDWSDGHKSLYPFKQIADLD